MEDFRATVLAVLFTVSWLYLLAKESSLKNRWRYLVPMALFLVFTNIAPSQANGFGDAVAGSSDQLNAAATESVISSLLAGTGVSVVPGSVEVFGVVESFTSADTNGAGSGFEIGAGLLIAGGGLGSGLNPLSVNSSGAPAAAQAIITFMQTVLTTANQAGNPLGPLAGTAPTTVTNFSAISFDATSSVSKLGVEFLFASNEFHDQHWDIAVIAVNGVNYGVLQTNTGPQLIRIQPKGEIVNVSGSNLAINGIQLYSAAETEALFVDLDLTKSIHEILLAVGDTGDDLKTSFLLFNFEGTPPPPTPSFAFTPSVQPELTQTGQFLTCKPGKFEFASSEIKMNSIIYTLMIDNQPVSELVIDGDRAIPQHTLNSFKQSVLGVATNEMAVWDMTGKPFKNASCNVTVYKHGSSYNLTTDLVSVR